MIKKILSFLKLANNSLPKNNESNIQVQNNFNQAEKPVYVKNLGKKLFPKIYNLTTKEKFNVPEILNNCNRNNHGKLESWLFYDYLRNFESLTEAKYKLMTLNVLFKNRCINIDVMPSIKDIVEIISDELFSLKETNFKIKELFFSSKTIYDGLFIPIRLGKGHVGTNDIIKQFHEVFEQDSNDEEKINIAKKIWSDFASAGLLADALKDSSVNTECFANLQDYKLYDSDLNSLKEATNQQKSNNDILPPSLYSFTEYSQIWRKLIDNEYEIEKLIIIKNLAIAASLRNLDIFNFLNNQLGIRFQEQDKKDDEVLKHVSSRINYLEIKTDISSKKIDKPKLKKIKI